MIGATSFASSVTAASSPYKWEVLVSSALLEYGRALGTAYGLFVMVIFIFPIEIDLIVRHYCSVAIVAFKTV